MDTKEQPDGHTKGPWMAAAKPSYLGWPIVPSPSGRMICDVTHVSHGPIDPKVSGDDAFNRESQANGRLIAAAPDLLEALILLEAEMVLSGNAGSKDYGWKPTIEKTRAAIAKALGQ